MDQVLHVAVTSSAKCLRHCTKDHVSPISSPERNSHRDTSSNPTADPNTLDHPSTPNANTARLSPRACKTWQVAALRKGTREEVRELQKTLQATLADMQALVDAKTGELAESAHRNVQLGARVRDKNRLLHNDGPIARCR